MKCSNCGFDVGDFPFCPKCGTQVLQKSQEAPSMETMPDDKNCSEEAPNGSTDNEKTQQKKSKRSAAWIIAGGLLLALLVGYIRNNSTTSTSTTHSSSTSSKNSTSSSSYSTTTGFTNDELETLACSALYDKLMSSKTKQGVPFTNLYNIDGTKYSIGSIKGNSSEGWTIKGTFSLYNDYGKYKKSGTFSAKVSSFGYATCTISID